VTEHDEEFDFEVEVEEPKGEQLDLGLEDEVEEEDERAHARADDGDDDDDESDDEPEDDDLDAPVEKVSKVVLEKLKQTEEQLTQTRQHLWQQEKKEFLGRYDEIQNKLTNLDTLYAEAIETQDGVTATKLIRYRDELKQTEAQMRQQWDQVIAAEESANQRAQQESQYSHQVKNLASRWQREFGYHKYDKQAKATIFKLDDQYARSVAKHPPSDPRYWQGLSKYIEQKTERQGMADNSRSNNNNSQSARKPIKTVYISPERKEALIQAGVWDDPVLRNRYVKRYQEWDRENRER